MVKQQYERLSDQLRRIIENSGESRYSIAKATGLNESVLSRFMASGRGMSTATLDKLGRYFDLEIRPQPRGRRTRKAKG
jgi:transcriptional regulator with XRE-family HTH domain